MPQNTKDINCIIDENATPSMITEVKKLLAQQLDVAVVDQRLFELYIQRQELNMLTHDFRTSEAFFGAADETNAFDWSQFLVEDWKDVEKYEEKVKAAEAKLLLAANRAAGIDPNIVKEKSWKKKNELIIPGEDGMTAIIFFYHFYYLFIYLFFYLFLFFVFLEY